jgi:DMSO reductase anchor subunit
LPGINNFIGRQNIGIYTKPTYTTKDSTTVTVSVSVTRHIYPTHSTKTWRRFNKGIQDTLSNVKFLGICTVLTFLAGVAVFAIGGEVFTVLAMVLITNTILFGESSVRFCYITVYTHQFEECRILDIQRVCG